MFYRPAAADTDNAFKLENEFGAWEWIIVDLDANEAPQGWQDAPVNASSEAPKKASKVKAKPEPEADGDGN